MKKTASIVCSIALGISLAACGAAGSAASAGSTAASAASTTTASTASEFVGTWKLAATVIDDGSVMVGDFTTMLELDKAPQFTISADGTGSGYLTGKHSDSKFTWADNGDGSIQLTIAGEADLGDWKLALEDGMLSINCQAGGSQTFSYTEYFSQDGSYPEYAYVDASKATAAKSADDIIGSWKLVGLNTSGTTLYYNGAANVKQATGATSDDIVFSKDGSFTMLGVSKGTWQYSASGATLKEVVEEQGLQGLEAKLTLLDGLLLIDASEMMGQELVYVCEPAA